MVIILAYIVLLFIIYRQKADLILIVIALGLISIINVVLQSIMNAADVALTEASINVAFSGISFAIVGKYCNLGSSDEHKNHQQISTNETRKSSKSTTHNKLTQLQLYTKFTLHLLALLLIVLSVLSITLLLNETINITQTNRYDTYVHYTNIPNGDRNFRYYVLDTPGETFVIALLLLEFVALLG